MKYILGLSVVYCRCDKPECFIIKHVFFSSMHMNTHETEQGSSKGGCTMSSHKESIHQYKPLSLCLLWAAGWVYMNNIKKWISSVPLNKKCQLSSRCALHKTQYESKWVLTDHITIYRSKSHSILFRPPLLAALYIAVYQKLSRYGSLESVVTFQTKM